MFGIYAGTSADKIGEVLDVVSTECRRLKTELLSDQELHAAKEQMKGHLLLSMESTDHRMTRLAKNEIYLERHLSPEETVVNIENVKKEDIRELAGNIFTEEGTSLAALGRVSTDVLHRDMLRL
jgi:predicted Zn-dependent peptidase